MIVNALYNIVDQIFIGQGVGYLGNGATNVILPITVLGCVATLIRQAVTIILAAVIFPLYFGIDGVLYSGPFAVSVSAVIIFFIIWPQLKRVGAGK